MKILKIIYIILFVVLSFIQILHNYFYPFINEDNWWLKNIISSRNFFDAISIVLLSLIAIAIVYLLYKLLRYIISSKRNILFAVSSLFVFVLIYFYYFAYYQPAQYAQRIFGEKIKMKLVDEKSFDRAGTEDDLRITHFSINATSQQKLIAKDSLAWYNTRYCKINDESAQYVEQNCAHWLYENNTETSGSSPINYDKATGIPNIAFLKARVKDNFREAERGLNNNGVIDARTLKSVITIKDEISILMKNPKTLYLLSCTSADEGHLLAYKVWILSENKKDLWCVHQRNNNFLGGDCIGI